MSYRTVILADGPSYYWRLNDPSGTVATEVIGGVNGTISGGVTLNQPGALVDGDKAMTFDGTDTAKITTSLSGVSNGAAALSWELWARLNSLSAPNGLRMVSQLGNLTTENYFAYSTTSGGQWLASLFIAGAQRTVVANGADLLWHHMVATFDGANLGLYRDGVLMNTTVMVGTVANAGAFVIGNWNIAGYGWLGSVDEVAIYPYALTAAQIKAHYDARTLPFLPGSYPAQVVQSGASNYWRLDEASGTTAVDVVGGVNGTISGGVTLAQPGALSDGDKAMTFDGSTGKIVPIAPGSVPIPYTWELWINTTAPNAVEHCILSSYLPPYSTSVDAALLIKGVTGATYLYFLPGGGGTVGGTATTTIAINDGAWHHLVMVVQTGDVKIYQDGVLRISSAIPGIGPLTRSSLIPTFAYRTDASTFFPGSLDEVAIYPRALTAAEIKAHYEASAFVPGSYQARVIADGASSYWRLNEPSGTTAVDMIAGLNGTITAGVLLNQPGILPNGDTAMAFNGTTGAITVPNAAGVNFGTGSFSIEAWLNPLTTTGARNIVGKGADVLANAGWRIGRSSGSSLNVAFAISDGVTQSVVTGSSVLTAGTWAHVVLVVDRTAQLLSGYVNGVAVGVAVSTAAVGTVTTATPLTIGGMAGVIPTQNGTLDEVAIYPRALTLAQIQAHYLAGTSMVVADGALGYWRFEETAGTTAVATVGTNGVISGAVTLNQPGPFPAAQRAYLFAVTGRVDVNDTVFNALTAVTVECWLKPGIANGSDVLMGKGTSNLNDMFTLGEQVEALSWRVYQNHTLHEFQQILTPTSVVGQWTHLVGTFDATKMQLFVDGVLVGQKPTGYPLLTAVGTPLRIGPALEGLMDEVAIYGTVLTPSQIAAHFAVAVPPLFPPGSAGANYPWWAEEDEQMVPYNQWTTITPSDTVDFVVPPEAIWVSGAGNIVLVMGNNTTLTIFAPAGSWLPLKARRVNLSGTTATGLVAMYHV